MTPEQLEAIEGIGPKTVEKISLAVNNYFASLEAGVPVEGEVPAEGEAVAEEIAPEAAAEAVEGEVAAEGELAAAPEEKAGAEAASDEKTEEHKPESGSAPETTE
jgi:N utilization substance protein A